MHIVRTVQRGLGAYQHLSLRHLAFVWLFVVLGPAVIALGQDAASLYIEPRVTRPQFDAFIRQFSLGRDQRNVAELAFEDYQTTLTELTKQADDTSIKAGRQSVQDAISGKARVSPDELKRMQLDVLKVYEQMFPVIDTALDQLIGGIRVSLNPEQDALFDSALRDLRRQIMLHPRQSSGEDYAGDGVDVLLMVEDARKDGGELASIDPQTVAPILADYESQLDAFLLETSAAYRQGRLMARMASVQKDSELAAQERQASIDRWKRLYQLNLTTVDRIGAIVVENAGERAQQAWRDRYDAACFAWMYPRKKPDRQIEWIVKQTTMTAEQRQKAQQVFDQYQARRKELNRLAIDLMLRARLEFQTMLYSMMDPTGMDDQMKQGLYSQLLKNSGEQASLDAATSASLEGVLDDVQRKAMRDAMKGPDPGRKRTR